MVAMLIELQTGLLHHALPQVPPEHVAQALQQELAIQDGLAGVLEDVVSEAARTKHAFWGFRILRPDGKEFVRVLAPKQLVPTDPNYVATLAMWGNIYAMVSLPAMRAPWRAIGAQVEFFQIKAPSPIIRP